MNETRIYCAGQNDVQIYVDGWYGLQRSPEGLLFRSSTAKARLVLPEIHGPVRVSMLLSARPEHTQEPLRGKVVAGESSSFPFELQTNQWTTREGAVELGEDSTLTLVVENPWSPDRLYQNGDARSLGIMLSTVRVTPLYTRPSISNNLWTNLNESGSVERSR